MTSKPEEASAESTEDANFLAQLEATFLLDPVERVSTYEAMAEKLKQELDSES